MGICKSTAPCRRRQRGGLALPIIALAVAVMSGAPAVAEELGHEQEIVDVSRITCGEFGRMPLPRALVLVGWIGGFYAGQTRETRVEVPAFIEVADRVIALCREDEAKRLMAVVDEEVQRLDPRTSGTRGGGPSR